MSFSSNYQKLRQERLGSSTGTGGTTPSVPSGGNFSQNYEALRQERMNAPALTITLPKLYTQRDREQEEYEAKLNFDLDAGQREVDDLDLQITQMKQELKTNAAQFYISGGTDPAATGATATSWNRLRELEKTRSQKITYLNQARRLQEGVALSGVANPESDNFDPNFEAYSGYHSTKSDNLWDRVWSQYSMGYDDLTYEYINGANNGMRDEILQKSGSFGSDNPWDDGETTFQEKGYDYMTEQEIGIYNYYYAKEGKAKAEQYLDSIQETLSYRKATEGFSNIRDNIGLELLFGVEAGLDQFESGMKNLVNTEDTYIPQTYTQMVSGMVREDLHFEGPRLPGWMGGASLGQIAYDTVTTSANMAPSILTSMAIGMVNPMAGSVAGTAMMGASAAGNAYQEALNLGHDKDQARAYAALIGASEAGLQYLLGGVTKLGGKISGNILNRALGGIDNAFLRTAVKLGGNMLSEGMEEGLQEILTPWFMNLTLDTNEKVDWGEVTYSFLLGAITAGFMEGTSTVSGEVDVYKTGRQLQQADVTAQRLAEIGSTMSADSAAYQLAGRVSENTGAYTMGRLFNEIGAEITQQNQTDIQNALMSAGVATKDAKILAKGFADVVAGAALTETQVAAIEANDVLAKVVKDVIIDPNSTVSQRTKGYNDVLNAMAGENTSRTNPASQGQENGESEGKFTPENSEAQEDTSEVSTDGKTILTKTGEEVTVQEIVSNKDGKMRLRLEDGRVVDSREVSFGTQDQALVYEMVAEMGVNPSAANILVRNYTPGEGITGKEYVIQARSAYRFGAYGISESELKSSVLTDKLSDVQRNQAYKLGKMFGGKQTAKAQATVKKGRTSSQKKEGKVHFDGDRSTLTDRQKVSLAAIEKVAEALGLQVYIFESQVDENGNRTGANGWYDPKDGSIHIDLYAGISGEATMLFTAAHELTHFIKQWSPAKFKALANFLMKEYGKQGVSVDALVREQMAKAQRSGRELTYDAAYEEMVADSMETMLSDGAVVEKLAKLKAQDKALWEKIQDYFTELVAKIRKVYEGLSPDSVEGRYVAEMKDAAEKLQSLFAEGLVDAGENFQSSEQTLAESGIAVNGQTESGSIYSVRDVLSDKDRKKVAKALADRFGVTLEEAQSWLTAETSLASIILNPKYSVYLDYEGDPGETAIKQNSDYPQGTVDFSNICKKRREFTQVMNRILRNFPNHVFAATDLAKIRTIMGQEGMTLPCGICYVEDRRQLDTIIAQDFIDSLRLYREGSQTRADGKPFNPVQIKALQMLGEDTYVPTIYELVSLEGRNSLKAKNPAMEAAWVKYNNARGMQSARLLTNEAEYKRQILKYNRKTVQSKNDHGGLRIYSFSDAEMFHLIDIIQVITDSATVGLSIQGYTKVNEYAKAVKDTGEKLNRSLIPKGEFGYHMEGGKVVLDYDTVEGIDITSPDFFDSKDNPNVGNITIGVSDTQIRAAMVSDFIDQIIPFHTGQSKDVLGEKGIGTWKNYKDFQTEKDMATGRTAKHQVNIYTEVIQAAEAEGKPIRNKRQFVEKFLQVCKDNGLQPRFSQFLNTDSNGDFVYTEGYHKFLVDFKTFAQTETGEYLPQMPVKPIFDDAYITKLLKDYAKEQKAKDAEVAEQMPKVIQRITDEIIKPSQDSGIKLSDRDRAPVFYSQMAKVIEGVKQEKLGAASVVNMLRGKGVKAEEIKWSGIETWLEGKKSVTKAELLEFVSRSMLSIQEVTLDGKLDLRFDGHDTYTLYDAAGNKIDSYRYNDFVGGLVGDISDDIYTNAVEMEDALRDKYADNAPRWSEHKLEGGENYREIIFRMPDSGYSNQAMEVHWGKYGEGVLAHVRIQDFQSEKGRMLFIEEIQSDWHNEGGKSGYIDEAARAAYIAERDQYPAERVIQKYGKEAWDDYNDPVKIRTMDWPTYMGINEIADTAMNEWEKANPEKHRQILSKGAPDAPFRNTYQEYVLKRLLRMAAEEGYDSIGWTTAKQQMARWSTDYAEGYRIEYDQEIPKFLRKYGKKWGAEVDQAMLDQGWNPKDYDEVKDEFLLLDYIRGELEDAIESNASADRIADLTDMYDRQEEKVNHLQSTGEIVWAVGITEPMRRSVLSEGQPMYSVRDSESMSNRFLLARAMEGIAKTDAEKTRLQEYKDKVEQIDAEERHLRDLKGQIKDLSFAKGPRDKAKIQKLRDEATKTANRINIFDKQLLRLEASSPLKAVLEREKKKAYDRAKKRGDEAIKAYRETMEARQADTVKRYQESRAKGVENRKTTAMRHKVQRIVKELNDYLLHGTKDRHVPIELQKAVAEALDAVNMDTVGAEERLARLEADLLKAKTPEKIQEISRTIDRVKAAGDKMSDRLQALKNAYDQFLNSDDPMIANSHDTVIADKLESVIESIGDTPLRDMTLAQLEDVYDMYRMVLTTVRNANKAFKTAKGESITELAFNVMSEVKGVGGQKAYQLKGTEGLNRFRWNNQKPVYAFQKIGSSTFAQLFDRVRSGEDTWARDVTEARDFFREQAKKHGFDGWDFSKRRSFESASEKTFSLSLEQIMSLYAFSKREQARDHLRRGGIVIDETTEVTMKTKLGIKMKFNPTEATSYNITDATLADIIGSLTPQQKAFVDAMQDYLSTTMGAKGNEVSLELYGIKLFKEKHYFPLRSAVQFMAKAKEQQQGDAKIKNKGFTKETSKKANNPIVLTPFMDVWAGHVNEMSMYHAFTLPMEDFYRVYNFKTPTSETTATESVEMLLQNAHGKAATAYIDQLLKDLNGGARTDSRTDFISKSMGMFKKGAVFASLSVVVQQPSAIARAAALIDTKYFIGPKVDPKRHDALWEEVKKYAPVAVIKEMGYFDTNMGMSTKDFITSKEYSGFGEKMRAVVADGNYRDEILSKAPALADEIAWCGIWEAVKRETAAKHKGMNTKSAAFLQLAGTRFTEVIVKTQVYDSVLARSALMRSKDTGLKMATAFLAEPTTSINMIEDALIQGKRGNKRYCRAAIGSVIASQILNAILVSFVYAGRDEDEEKTYWEKYLGSLTGKVLDGLNPATYIPFIKDIVSIIQGYDVERSDMSVISDLWNAWKKLRRDDVPPYRKVEDFVGSIAQIFGLPVKNIMRDARGIYNTINSFMGGNSTAWSGIRFAVQENLPGILGGGEISRQNRLYHAIVNGDTAYVERLKGTYADETAYNTAIRKAMRENDPRIHAAAVALENGNLNEYTRIVREIVSEKHFSQDLVVTAINAEINAMNSGESSGSTQKAKSMYSAEDFTTAIIQGDEAMALAIQTEIIRVAQLNGKDEDEAADSFADSAKKSLKAEYLAGNIGADQAVEALTQFCFESQEDAEERVGGWEFEREYGFAYSDRKEQYQNGAISAQELHGILTEMGGMTDDEASLHIQVYDWEKEVPGCDDITMSAIRDYNEHCQGAGITRNVYYEAWSTYRDTDGDLDANGDSIPYSKVPKVMRYINSLPLSAYQKTVLAECWWATSTVLKYKLW